MHNIFPLVNPPIETYQGCSFILSVLLAYENTENVYYNNYINLECNNTDSFCNIDLNFTDVLWENYLLSGVAEMNLYHLKNIHRDYFVSFIKERIDQGNYLIFYSIDEYHLSYTTHYNHEHHLHDTYLYGYEDESFCVMAYKGGKLSKFNVPIWEILTGMYCQMSSNTDVSFCTFRPSHAANEVVNLSQMQKLFCDYYYSNYLGKKITTKIYGISTYDVLMKCIDKTISDRIKTLNIDLRPFRLFWEHKKVLKDHIEKIKEYIQLNYNISIMIIEIEKMADIIFKLIIKYSITKNSSLLKRVIIYLMQLRKEEEKFFYLLLDELSKNRF